jgi:4-alpha-glucanotransferase
MALGADARMNTPGTAKGNWSWRFDWKDVPAQRAAELRRMNETAGRVVAEGEVGLAEPVTD